jgi:hypothetical protein
MILLKGSFLTLWMEDSLYFNMSTTQFFFMEYDLEKARNMKLILSAFEQLSGFKINFYKSELFCFGEA